MSSITNLFKRPRSKSEKAGTPPKIVFGDLNSAYASIAQKSSPGTPNERREPQEGLSSPADTTSPWSAVQSPRSDASPSVPLLKHPSPDAIRVSHLSGDLFLPKDFHTGESKPDLGHAWDPFVSSTTGQHRGSYSTLNFKKHVLDEYFDTNAGKDNKATAEVNQQASRRESQLLPANEYPELGEAQLEACSKLSGLEPVESIEDKPLDRCGTIQSLSSRHEYGRIETNADILSLYGAHSNIDDFDETEKGLESGSMGPETVKQVDWSPRSSEESQAWESMHVQRPHIPGGPPPFHLPRTPKGKEVIRNDRTEDPSSPSEDVSHSPESYGNTRKLLQLSLPHFPQTPAQGNDFFKKLIDFAKEGQSSSSHGSSNKSYAKFSIEEANGRAISRPVSQGEFQQLEQAISSHLRRRDSRAELGAAGNGLVRVGQISLRFSDEAEKDEFRAPSSQTVSSSRSDVDVAREHGGIQDPVRTRNGTPPLLFGSLSRPKTDNDWETVGDSNEFTSSIADYSDSASRSPPKESLFMAPSKVLRHPAHPRYNHSWDLQQDVRSGQYVLTPRYELSSGSLFPNRNAIEPLSLRPHLNPYSHPTPLNASHSHPFASPAPQIVSSRSAVVYEAGQHIVRDDTNWPLQSQRSSNWVSTAASRAATSFVGVRNSLTAPRIPPLPTRNPWRQVKKLHSEEQFELQSSINPKARSDPALVKGKKGKMDQTPPTKHDGKDFAEVSTISTMASGAEGPSSQVRFRSPHRHNGGKHSIICSSHL